jgi:hypothetical protein
MFLGYNSLSGSLPNATNPSLNNLYVWQFKGAIEEKVMYYNDVSAIFVVNSRLFAGTFSYQLLGSFPSWATDNANALVSSMF